MRDSIDDVLVLVDSEKKKIKEIEFRFVQDSSINRINCINRIECTHVKSVRQLCRKISTKKSRMYNIGEIL